MLARRLQTRGLILELVPAAGQLPGQPFAVFASEARSRQGRGGSPRRCACSGMWCSTYNEHDHPDGPITHARQRTLRDRVKAIDSADRHHLEHRRGTSSRRRVNSTRAICVVRRIGPRASASTSWRRISRALMIGRL